MTTPIIDYPQLIWTHDHDKVDTVVDSALVPPPPKIGAPAMGEVPGPTNGSLTISGGINRQSAHNAAARLFELAGRSDQIRLVINSPGGSILDGLYLFDTIGDLRRAGVRIDTHARGLAASMGSVLLQAGQVRSVGLNSWVMIHNASFGVEGSTYEVADQLALTRRFEDTLVDIYVTRSGGKMTERELRERWHRQDVWLTAAEALAFGLVDRIGDGLPEQGARG